MKIKRFSHLNRDFDECLDYINNYIETNGIKKKIF